MPDPVTMSTDEQAEQILGALSKPAPEPGAAPIDNEDAALAESATEIEQALAKATTNAPEGEAGAAEKPPTGDQKAAPVEPAQPAIEPPKFWKAEHAERWKQLPAELQTYLVEQAEENTRAVNAKFTEAAEARKAGEKARTDAEAAVRNTFPTLQAKALEIDNLLNTVVATDPILARGSDPQYWVKLAESDPARLAKERAEFDARVEQVRPLFAKRQELVTTVIAGANQQRQDFLADQNRQLFDKLPDWKADGAKARQELNEIQDYGMKTYGVTSQEIHGLGDHRLVLLMRDAMMLNRENADLKQKLTAATTRSAEVKQQIEAKKVPVEAPKVAKPGAAQDVEQGTSQRARALKSHALKTGKVTDQIDAVMAALR